MNLLNILNNFVTLRTLNILAICGKIESADELAVLAPVTWSIISSKLAITTKKSNTFHPDKKYPFPKVNIFKTHSIIKMILNTKFI